MGIDWQLEAGGVDVLGRREGESSFAVEVKRVQGPNRVEQLKGVAAMAILQLQRHAPDTRHIVWLHVDRLTQKVVGALAAYFDEVSPHAGWVLVDEESGMEVRVPMLGLELSHGPARAKHQPRHGSMFSDLNMWLLKVLLMRGLPERLWSGPRERPKTVSALAEIASVSQTKAHRFAKIMTDAGFLRRGAGGLELIRIEALLRAWRSDYRTRVVSLEPVQPVFELEPAMLQAPAGVRLALGGQLAAREFGLSHVRRGREVIWTDAQPHAVLDALELVPATRANSLYLGTPPYCESMFRGRIERGSVHYVDPCELMLESVFDPHRGLEQSDYILAKLLAWHAESE